MVCLINFIGLSESRRFEDSSGRVCWGSFTDKIRAKTPVMGEFTDQDLSRLMGEWWNCGCCGRLDAVNQQEFDIEGVSWSQPLPVILLCFLYTEK